MASSGHVSATPGAWLAVTLVVVAFILGTFALTTHAVVLWVLTGVAMAAGLIAGIASHIMEQAY